MKGTARLAVIFALGTLSVVATGRPGLPKQASAPTGVGYLMLDGKRVEVPFPVVHGAFSFDHPGRRLSLRPEDLYRSDDEEPDNELEAEVSESQRELLGKRTACDELPPARAVRGDEDDGATHDEQSAREERDYATWRTKHCKPADGKTAIRQIVVHSTGTDTVAAAYQIMIERQVSTHLFIDWDGTVYQAADLGALAYHAGPVNHSSVGVDLVAPAVRLSGTFDRPFESVDPLIAAHGQTRAVVHGMINGTRVRTFGHTEAQQKSLRALCAALAGALPHLDAAVPRNTQGQVINWQIQDAERFSGLMGHYHVSLERWDPGPNVDWDGIVQAMRDARNLRRRN